MSAEIIDEIMEAHDAGTDIADALLAVADAGEKLLNSGVTKRAILVLIKDRLHGVGLREIDLVVSALPELRQYVREQEQEQEQDQ